MTNDLAPLITRRNFAIIDNSSTHKTVPALTALRDCFRGQYAFSAQYYPDLKPIEKGFSQVKRWLRNQEDACLADPIFWINKAFGLCSVQGRRSNRGSVHPSFLYILVCIFPLFIFYLFIFFHSNLMATLSSSFSFSFSTSSLYSPFFPPPQLEETGINISIFMQHGKENSRICQFPFHYLTTTTIHFIFYFFDLITSFHVQAHYLLPMSTRRL